MPRKTATATTTAAAGATTAAAPTAKSTTHEGAADAATSACASAEAADAEKRPTPQCTSEVRVRVTAFVGGPLAALTHRLAALLDEQQREPRKLDDFDKSLADLKADFSRNLDDLVTPERALAKQLKAATDRLNHRTSVLKELLVTEWTYLHDLRFLTDIWQPEIVKSNALSPEVVTALFGGIPQMATLSTQLVGDLHRIQQLELDQQRIGACFLKRAPFFRMYCEYSASQESARDALKEAKKAQKFLPIEERFQEQKLTNLGFVRLHV
eukprot:TRINITY_DN742_c0_g1_i5.p1 TRINITY_DN742_c0_g1~~TRINITY_DN742_c0_g1_i5.p1  ORF type:complete len:300 (+),score=66.28 TRINITY_DN742_c0_g1_i5:95-901(+)